jgi:hypothetical protein
MFIQKEAVDAADILSTRILPISSERLVPELAVVSMM